MIDVLNRGVELMGMGVVGVLALIALLIAVMWVYAKVVEPLTTPYGRRECWRGVKATAFVLFWIVVIYGALSIIGLGVEWLLHAAGLRTPEFL